MRVNLRWRPRLKQRMIFGSGLAAALVGRVSLRDRRTEAATAPGLAENRCERQKDSA